MSLYVTESGWALASKRRGASHIRKGTPCQDAYTTRYKTIGGKSCFALAVAGGHGAARHDLSQYGAELAVESAAAGLLALFGDSYGEKRGAISLEDNFKRNFPRRTEQLWREQVLKDAATRLSAGPPAGTEELQKLLGRYGTTLLTALVLPEWLLFSQIGDGDILCLYPDGTIQRPLGDPPRHAACSLSSPDVKKRWQTAVLPRRNGEMLLLASDGLRNAFADKAEFQTFTLNLMARIAESGASVIDPLLSEWLDNYSAQSGGDDITLVLHGKISGKKPSPEKLLHDAKSGSDVVSVSEFFDSDIFPTIKYKR
ncbi:MAG: protein phosphatase 2C domain-containing protein [Gammaproteobacteria bacterium]|nr:protein phosphatase 2C domain-containing protein [Gammaproteobacteria bacterium]